MLKQLILAIGLAVALVNTAHADPQKFSDQAAATKFCKEGNVVWCNPDTKSISRWARSSSVRPRPAAIPARRSPTRKAIGPRRANNCPDLSGTPSPHWDWRHHRCLQFRRP